jgi:hypothetical protein
MMVSTLDDLRFEPAMQHCGELVDLAGDLGVVEAIDRAIGLIESLRPRMVESSMIAQFHYFLGNAWTVKDQLSDGDERDTWDWNRPAVERSIIAYRQAVREPGIESLPGTQRARILTNLANALDRMGRFVVASAIYRAASDADPSFGMPRINRGIALRHYSEHVHDRGHKAILIWHAHHELATGCALTTEVGAKHVAEANRDRIRRAIDPTFLDAPLDFDDYSLGETEEEVAYRRWCLSNLLFLNPINDCVDHAIAAHDVLHLPSMVRPLAEGPGFHGFINQMKQEYASARFLLYESTMSTEAHYSDFGVKMVNTLDFPCYGLAFEKMRLAFRMAFAVLDKVSVFLALYLGLKGADFTGFRNVWYRGKKAKSGLRPELDARPNWPMRGLFWLSKDLYRNVSCCGDELDPEAIRLRDIRNEIEHGYLKVTEYSSKRDDDPLC